MRWGRAAALAVAGAALACSSMGARPRRAPPDPDLRIWVPPIVHWSPGGERALDFAIENGTHRTLEVSPPDPRAAGVAVYVEPGEARVCAVEPAASPRGDTLRLAPGDQVAVRVDLGEACGALPPGEYRFELTYRAERPAGGTLALAPRYGTLVVDGPARNARRPAGPQPRPPSARVP